MTHTHTPCCYWRNCKWYKWWQEWKYDEGKEAKYPYDNSTIDMEEGVSDRNDDKNEKYDEEKEA